MPEYLLPDVGEGLTEAEIVTWRVKVGDEIAVNDIVVDIETAKSIVELPSPYAGTVTALLVPEGETVPVGTPIIAIGEPVAGAAEPASGGDGGRVATADIDLSNPAASGGGEGESLVGRNKAEREAARRPRRAGAAPASQPSAPVAEAVPVTEPAPVAEPVSLAEVRVLAKPPVRKLAKDLGVDLTALVGSGEGGVVTRADVEAAASGPESTGGGRALRDASFLGSSGTTAARDERRVETRETREPIKGVRKMMGQAMVDSAFSAPHVTEWVTLDATRTMDLVERLKAHREFADVKVSPLLVLARAVLLAMRRTPIVNSYWDDSAQEVVVKHYVNLGIAAATPRGLVVPNVKEAQAMSLHELAQALEGLTATAREGRTQPAEMSGGTFTITNVGVFGVDSGTPIINPGESAILAFGAIRKQPWVVSSGGVDEIAIRQVTTLALSFDHRHIDGESGSRFLADVAAILEDPATALLY